MDAEILMDGAMTPEPKAKKSKKEKRPKTEIMLDLSPQEAEGSAAGFISLADPSDTPKTTKTEKQKAEKPAEKPAQTLPMPIMPKTDTELGKPDAKGIPTIHPKTGQPLSKKARKIIAKRKSKMEMKNGRAEVRARRQAKKAERAKQAAAKKKV